VKKRTRKGERSCRKREEEIERWWTREGKAETFRMARELWGCVWVPRGTPSSPRRKLSQCKAVIWTFRVLWRKSESKESNNSITC
jgi:hypothetical protein